MALDYVRRLADLQGMDNYVDKASMDRMEGKAFCSFCGMDKEEVKNLLVGKANVCICSDCVAACAEVLSKESEEKAEN